MTDNLRSELSWTLDDYIKNGDEPPERVKAKPDSCEANLMSDEEVVTFIDDSLVTLMVLKDKQSPATERTRKYFLADLVCLHKAGRIKQSNYEMILKMEEEQ